MQTLMLEEFSITLKDLEDAFAMGGSKDLVQRYKNQPVSMKKSASNEGGTARGRLTDGEEPTER